MPNPFIRGCRIRVAQAKHTNKWLSFTCKWHYHLEERKLEMPITAATATSTTNKWTSKSKTCKPTTTTKKIPHIPNECRSIRISSNWFAWEIRFITNVQKFSDSKCKLPDIRRVMENRRIKNKSRNENNIDFLRPEKSEIRSNFDVIQIQKSRTVRFFAIAIFWVCVCVCAESVSFRKMMPKECTLIMQFMQEMCAFYLPLLPSFLLYFCKRCSPFEHSEILY